MAKNVNISTVTLSLFRTPIVWSLKIYAFMAFVGVLGTLFMRNREIGNALAVALPVTGFIAYYTAKKYDQLLERMQNY